MKWISHKLTTFAIYYSISEETIQSLIASASSVFPDLIETGPGRIIFRKHRGTSHNPIFWLIILPFFYYGLKKMVPEVNIAPFNCLPGPESLFWTITGGVTLHLIADSLSGLGIPLWGNKRFALKVYKTFTLSEFAVVSFVLLSCGISIVLVRFLLT